MEPGERFNTITHIAGLALAAGGAALLIVLAALRGDPWKIVSFSIYGATLGLLYLFSSLYHGIRHGKAVLREFDHGAIYFLIAGTYTPFTLVTLRGPLGWTIFGVVWGLALIGIVVDLLLAGRRRIIPIVIYLVMGWLAVVAYRPLLRSLPMNGFRWLLAGGLLYTGGVVFYALGSRLRHGHGIWHLFVLGGSIAQFMAVLFYVV